MTSGVSHYNRLGGERAVRAIVDAFYDRIEAEYPLLRDMLPANTTVTRMKLFKYLSGWLGGPQLYVEEYGHPRLRMRHIPFPIDDEGVRQWLQAMEAALDDAGVDAELADELMALFDPLAHHMANR